MRLRTFVALGLGAAAAYFLDPEKGPQRRQMARSRAQSLMQQGSSQAQEMGRQAGISQPSDVIRKVGGGKPSVAESDYATLSEKVKTELFSDHEVKGQINVDAEEGVIYLRGELPTQAKIDEVIKKTRLVEGVKDVRNHIHTPSGAARS
jgi:osmotically-inducible protein OsmY